jgi:hypothetical protein
MTPRCWLASFSETPCDGRMDPVHLVGQQVMKVRYGITDEEVIWDKRNIVAGCRDHHHKFDNGFLRVPVSAVTSEQQAFADELGYDFRDDFRFEG